MKRPNILVAIADDAGHFGLSDGSFVNTPNIRRLAERGVTFNNAFTPSPKCAPSRAATLTGMLPWQLEGAFNHWAYFPAGYKFLPDYLDEGGYFTGYTGKGWAPGVYSDSGYKRNPAGNEYNTATLTPPEYSDISSCDYAENFRLFLDEKPNDSPFYFWYGCKEPHRPYKPCEGLRGGKTFDDIDYIPSYWPNTELTKIDMLDYAYEVEWFDSQLGKMLTELQNRGELDNTFILVTSDNGCAFPRVKGQMYEQDFHLPMVAALPGSSAVGISVDDHVMFSDIAPTILQLAELPTPDVMSGKSFAYVFDAKNGGLINSERMISYFGREQQDLGRRDDVGYPVRCIRTEKYLLVHNKFPERQPAGNIETGITNCDSGLVKEQILRLNSEGNSSYYELCFGKRPRLELYDISNDIECLNNLAYQEKYAATVATLKAQLDEFLTNTSDPAQDDPLYFDRMKIATWDHDDTSYSWQAYKEGRWSKQKY